MADTTTLEIPVTPRIDTPEHAKPEVDADTPAAERPRTAREMAMDNIVANRMKQVANELGYADTLAQDERQRRETQIGDELQRNVEAAQDRAQRMLSEERERSDSEAAEAARESGQPIPQRPVPQAPVLHTVRANGQDLSLTHDELVALAQQGLGANAKFQQAAQLRQQAEQLLQQHQTPAAPAPFASAPPAVPPAQAAPQATSTQIPALDEVQAREYAKRLLYGSEDDSTQAIAELANRLVQAARPPVIDQQALVNAAVEQSMARTAYQHTLQAIGQEFPQLFADNGLSVLAGQRAQELRAQYAQAGVAAQPYDIMRQACAEVQERYVSPTHRTRPAAAQAALNVEIDKLQRKRAAPQPPVAANRTAHLPAEPPAPTSSQVVAWMQSKRTGTRR